MKINLFEEGKTEEWDSGNQHVIKTNLEDCYVLKNINRGDKRGYFTSLTKGNLENFKWEQNSKSLSCKGTLRGLHFQRDPYCQEKVVWCSKGKVLDVIVDMREDSPTYKQYIAVELSPENERKLVVPRGYAHGFLALTDDAVFNYMVDNEYAPRLEGGVLWNDPEIGIPWDEIFEYYGIDEPILSDKDKNRALLENSEVNFLRRPKKYLVTGVNGQLGHDIVQELHERGEDDVLALDVNDMDITDRDWTMQVIKAYKPDVIFHCAAWTNVDGAEIKQEDCSKVNVDGTVNITDAAKAVGAKLVYLSTDYVFDGNKDLSRTYTEEDAPNPKSVYGLTKYYGEVVVRSNPKHFIARISWVFGENGDNFIKKMLELSDKYSELRVVNDQIGSPTYTKDLAKLLVEMAETDKYGTYNATNEGYCSWAEFAQYIMDVNGKDTIIHPVTTEEYYVGKDTSKIASRPKNSKLNKQKLEDAGFKRLPSWQDATKRYCEELSKSNKYWLECQQRQYQKTNNK